MPRKPKNNISGWINLNKPVGISSNDALMILKRALNYPKIGHAGTLDPLADGVLPVALGEATKLVPYMMEDDKTYHFTVTWGEERSTDDREGEVVATSTHRPTRDEILSVLPRFTGEIDQVPPAYSALKIDGERAYDLARAGAEFELKSRKVNVYELELLDCSADSARFRAVCGKGTYVRSLARDLGRALGGCGYISALMRQSVGPFQLDDAILLDFFQKSVDITELERNVLPIEAVLDDIPVVSLKDQEATRAKCGNKLSFISRPDVERLVAAGLDPRVRGRNLVLLTHQGAALAVAEVEGIEIQPVRVFNL
ncbi:MAG: tRNA pseudouridine(55) synthase TruB [Alphaproteobacteria bacterium]|nr:tRNA pseudouridine(55) synthase TruB [Alphaproteobacteria bacterium]